MLKKLQKILKWALISIVAVLILSSVWNFVCKRLELPKLENAYGQTVEVDGKNMVADIKGDAENPTIILLPGWGCSSPVLEFEPVSTELSDEYRVITIEPFGYGLSDRTKEERDVKTIVEELHECVEQLGCEEYYLMGHSISGIYSLYWANEYPQEVLGFIGIDPSVPKMSDDEPFPVSTKTINKVSGYLERIKNGVGLTRLQSIGDPGNAIYADTSYPYTEEELEIFRILSMDCSYNKTMMNEMDLIDANLEIVRDMKVPETIPVLEFVSGDNCEVFPIWEQLHKDIISENGQGEVYKLDGGHYLHFDQFDQVTELTREWLIKNQ